MDILTYIILFTLLGSVVSLIGGAILLTNEKFAIKSSHFLSSFAAGSLLGAAFFDLLPEAQEASSGNHDLFLWILTGIMTFFILERFISWFHHHHDHPQKESQTLVPLVVIGDSLHNFIDGVAIAGTFLVSIPLGIVTTLAVAAHEIPQEIGDFGILLHAGMKRQKILLINFFSALTSLAGALLAYSLNSSIEDILPIFLSLTAGFFIYIALSDLIPEIHLEEKRKLAFFESVLLILGILTIYIFVQVFGR